MKLGLGASISSVTMLATAGAVAGSILDDLLLQNGDFLILEGIGNDTLILDGFGDGDAFTELLLQNGDLLILEGAGAFTLLTE